MGHGGLSKIVAVTGEEKAQALVRLRAGDRPIPGSRLLCERACCLPIAAAAARLGSDKKWRRK